MTQKANTWKVTTRYYTKYPDEYQEDIFWYPTEDAAQTCARGFRLGGRSALVTRDTTNVR